MHIIISKQHRGIYISLGVLILSAGGQIFLPKTYYPPYKRPHPNCFSCATNLRGLGMAFIIESNDEEFIIPANWCDDLICNGDIAESSLYCHDSDARDGESAYALNRNLIGKTLWDIPADIVLLFESNLGKDSEKISFQERSFYSKLTEKEKGYFNSSKNVHIDQWNQVGGPKDVVLTRHLRRGCNILYTGGHVEFVEAEEIPNLRWTVDEKQ